MFGLVNVNRITLLRGKEFLMKNANTKFPSQIDDRVFFQDINISQVPVMKQYYSLLNSGAYTKASELLNNSEVFFYGAWCLNLLENRLFAIGNYAMNLEDINLLTYAKTEPSESEVFENMIWIG